MKQCISCQQVKDFSEFYTNGVYNHKQKYKPNCKTCCTRERKIVVEAKRAAIEARFGTACTICGYDRCTAALEFHHIDPAAKEYSPSNLINDSTPLKTVFAELEKCILLCSNCHREIHAGLISLER